jgi:NIMA (never in mitosis gene a)-related kinase 1/4/5
MSLKKYKKVKYLGQGSYGAAILVSLKSNSQEQFVIKEIVIGHLKESEQLATQNEVEVLKQMHHSNIAMYVESFVDNSKLYIVMEYADGGDLSAAIQRKKQQKITNGPSSGDGGWNEDEIMRIFVQICLALKHVHERNIIHRDLKAQNIFLTSKGIVKLGDFGIAKVLDATDGQARTQIGTPYYLSPEICDNVLYDTSSDIWSLGVILYELICLELPFTAQSLPALVIKICSSDPSWVKIETSYSPQILTLVRHF